MKKISVILFLCLAIGYPALCQAKTAYIESGEYAFYRDTRGHMDFIRGYLALRKGNELIVLSRNVDRKTKNEYNYYFSVRDGINDKGEKEFGIGGTVGLQKQPQTEILQACVDFLNFVTIYDSSKSQFKDCKTVEDPWDNYTLLYELNNALPLFRFNTITMKGKNEPAYVLFKGGILNSDSDGREFFEADLSQPEEIKRENVGLKIPKKNKMNVVLNGLKARLDENWKYNEEFGFPGYWLNVNGLRDSQIGIEKTDLSLMGDLQTDAFFTRMARTAVEHYPSPDYNSVQFRLTEKYAELSYFFLDENQRKNYQYYFFCKRDKNIYIVNFSTFADIYEANKSYFTDILSYVLKNNGLR